MANGSISAAELAEKFWQVWNDSHTKEVELFKKRLAIWEGRSPSPYIELLIEECSTSISIWDTFWSASYRERREVTNPQVTIEYEKVLEYAKIIERAFEDRRNARFQIWIAVMVAVFTAFQSFSAVVDAYLKLR